MGNHGLEGREGEKSINYEGSLEGLPLLLPYHIRYTMHAECRCVDRDSNSLLLRSLRFNTSVMDCN